MDIPSIVDYLSGLLWGLPAIIILVSTGLVVGILGGFYQIRKFGLAVKNMFYRGRGGKGEVKPFAIWAATVGAIVGTGNIAGVATAIHLGGPGALFWMWVTAILGMGLKGVEVTLAVWSRRVTPEGRVEGGTPYYIRLIPKIGPALSVVFAVLIIIGGFGTADMLQPNNVALGAEYIGKIFGATTDEQIFQVRLVTGILLMIFTALVILGGIKRIGEVSNYMVPFMAAWYIIFSIGVWIKYGGDLPSAFSQIITGAFNPQAVAGGLAGWTVFTALRYGMARALFSNEAGAGSTPNVYAYMTIDHPGRAAFYGIFEVFMDTIVICSVTGLTIVISGVHIERPDLSGAALVMEAFYRAYGAYASAILGVALALFAYTTMLTFAWIVEINWVYLFSRILKLPEKPMRYLVRVLWIVPSIPAAVMGELFETLWNFADMSYGLMMLVNVIAVVYFTPLALKLIKDFYSRHIYETGEVKK
ncbi:sodium:alanine symporter family protein [Thermosphaera chiliense]|uniref:Sodium:alanine symporter family protein n=1 Tax=Thermosphaera chiliense TaxID=3402707 RepID=A0A7M1UPQ1_9CREN|nr:amino acid carrier protein [Thermosphaera aggregans]QOR94181.1 sodium:alanine symporter family protein [Thermosphaera aggregans]